MAQRRKKNRPRKPRQRLLAGLPAAGGTDISPGDALIFVFTVNRVGDPYYTVRTPLNHLERAYTAYARGPAAGDGSVFADAFLDTALWVPTRNLARPGEPGFLPMFAHVDGDEYLLTFTCEQRVREFFQAHPERVPMEHAAVLSARTIIDDVLAIGAGLVVNVQGEYGFDLSPDDLNRIRAFLPVGLPTAG